jgi:MFS family permease
MAALAGGVGALSLVKMGRSGGKDKAAAGKGGAPQLRKLHKEFLFLHFFIKLADWLQGTNMFTLYTSYGVDPGILFMTGFITSAICSTFIGHWVDKYGRKKGCLVYLALEIVIQVSLDRIKSTGARAKLTLLLLGVLCPVRDSLWSTSRSWSTRTTCRCCS